MAEAEIDLLPLLADRNRISIDVGANSGEYARILEPLSREVHMFEPVPELAPILLKEFGPHPNTHFYPAAVSDRCGAADLVIPELPGLGEWHPLATIDKTMIYPVFRVDTFV